LRARLLELGGQDLLLAIDAEVTKQSYGRMLALDAAWTALRRRAAEAETTTGTEAARKRYAHLGRPTPPWL
jgi:hypothetical protein